MPFALVLVAHIASHTLTVAHDGALDVANLVSRHVDLETVQITQLRALPLSPACVHDAACTDRPHDDAILWITGEQNNARLELVSASGATVAVESVDATDGAQLDAALHRLIALIPATPPLDDDPKPVASTSPDLLWLYVAAAAGAGVVLAALGVLALSRASPQDVQNLAGTCACDLGQGCFDACLQGGCNALGDICAGICTAAIGAQATAPHTTTTAPPPGSATAPMLY